jgi:hypothetical protein
VLCRVTDDIDGIYAEWEAWYQPASWLSPYRALGAFLGTRFRALWQPAAGSNPGTRPETTQLRDMNRSSEELLEAGRQTSGCPCLYVGACSPNCSCVDPYLSGGCQRCAQYGSLEQRQAAARRIADALRSTVAGSNARPGTGAA